MAPCWPGTALLTTKAPRKLVFLFTLSLSVTYLFYSLLSCYSSLQFPLQDTGIYLQPEPGISPVDAIRTASLKPDTSSRDYNRDRQPLAPDTSYYVKSSDGSRDFILKDSRIGGVSALVSLSHSASPFPYSKPITGRQPSYTDLSASKRSQSNVLSPTPRTRVPLLREIHSNPDGAGTQGLRASTAAGSFTGSDYRDNVYIGSTAQSVSSLDSAPVVANHQGLKSPVRDIQREIQISERATDRVFSTPGSDQRVSSLDNPPVLSADQRISSLGKDSQTRVSSLGKDHILPTDQRVSSLDKDPIPFTNQRVRFLGKNSDQRVSSLDKDHIPYTVRNINIQDKDPIPFTDQRVSTLEKDPILSNQIFSTPFRDRRVSSVDKSPIPYTNQRVSFLNNDPTFTDWRVSSIGEDPTFTGRRVSSLDKEHTFTGRRVSTLDSDSVAFTDRRVSSLDKDHIPYTLDSSDINYTKERFGTSDSAPVTVSHRGFSNVDRVPSRDFSTVDSSPIVSDRGFSTLERAPIESSNTGFSTLDSSPVGIGDKGFSTLDRGPNRDFRTLESSPIDRDLSTLSKAPNTDFSTSDRAHSKDFSTPDSAPITDPHTSFSTPDSSPLSSFSTSNISPAPSSSYSIPVIPTLHKTSISEKSPVLSDTPKISPAASYLSNNIIDPPSPPALGNHQPHLTDGQTTTDSTASSNLSPQPEIFSTTHRDSNHSYQEAADINRDPIGEQTRVPGVSSGELDRLSDFPGNAMLSPLSGVPSWDRTPLAATEMIPEPHTGYLERDPQESSTTDDDLSRRIMVNSTVEYGDKRLPQAIIIGVKKGGTRALLEALRAHPDVRAVGVEPHFFDRNYEKGLEWYRDLMPRTIEGQITMEKTPSYFVTNEAPQRIYSMAKDTKLIVVVRNPVTRAISDYTQTLSKKPEIPTFEVLAFKNRTLGLIDASWSALRIGIYALHLESWMQFFPLSQILFVSGERLITNPAEELAKVQDFLGLQRIITDKYFYFNKTKGFPCLKKPEDTGAPRCLGKSKGRTHPKIDPDVIQRLRKFYKPFNAMFYQMTGQDFQWEKEELEG